MFMTTDARSSIRWLCGCQLNEEENESMNMTGFTIKETWSYQLDCGCGLSNRPAEQPLLRDEAWENAMGPPSILKVDLQCHIKLHPYAP